MFLKKALKVGFFDQVVNFFVPPDVYNALNKP